ncbi:MAG: sulfotransferase [Mycobacteriales bacterium]
MTERVRVLFLAGMGRSGTTLIERVLAAAPGAVGLGELTHVWKRGLLQNERCGCGLPFSECPFWQRVGVDAFGGWGSVDVAEVLRLRSRVDKVRHVPGLLLPSAALRRDRDSYGDRYAAVYRAAARLSGASVVIDSSKQASLPHVLAGRADVDLCVVHCVRDARAVCFAWTKRVARPDCWRGESYMDRYAPRTTAARWIAHNTAIELLRRQGVPVLRLRYEDLLADPVGRFAALARFAGLPPDQASLPHLTAEAADLPLAHTVSGNPLRFTVGRVPLRRDDAWRSAMPIGQRRLVTSMTWPLLMRYGYPALVRSS